MALIWSINLRLRFVLLAAANPDPYWGRPFRLLVPILFTGREAK
jgi:hypothetical protein